MRNYRFAFVSLLMKGKETAYRNFRHAIENMSDVTPVWIPVEMDPPEWFARIPPASRSHSLKYGMVARSRVLAAERRDGPFDAALFNHILPALFLGDFRSRVPCIDSMDVTPVSLLEHGKAYYVSPRTAGPKALREAKRRYARKVFLSSAHLVPYSDFTRDSLVKDYGVPEGKITVVPPGVDLSFWTGAYTAGDRINAKPFNVLFVGEEFRRKGGPLVAEVAQREEFANTEFHFVTGQFTGDRPANVFVHEGVTRNSDRLLGLFQRADVFVSPTWGDFGPTNAISEALAMGLPVIASGIGGIDEVVEDGKVGFIIPVGDAGALASKLAALRDNVPLRRSMAAAARSMAEQRLDVEKNAGRMLDFMRHIAR